MDECCKSFGQWLKKLLNGGTGQQWRSATEASVPPGFFFMPTDQILIVYYLLPYVLTRCIPASNLVVVERVYEKEPCELLDDDHNVGYFLAKRKKCGDRVKRSSVNGTWTVKEGKREIKSADGVTIIGYKTILSYCVKGKSEGYTMYEYELPQSVTNNFMQEEGAPKLHEWVLCCVKKSRQRIAGSKSRQKIAGSKSRPEAAAETKAGIVSSKQAGHDGAFEVSGEYPGCNTSAAVVAAASYNTEPLTEYKTASSMHLPTAAEASLEGRVHAEASDFASPDQIMSPSAVDRLPSANNNSNGMEDVNNTADTCKGCKRTAKAPASDKEIDWDTLLPLDSPLHRQAYSLWDILESAPVAVATSTAADCSAMSLMDPTDSNPKEQHLPPPSCQDGDQPTASAIHTGQNLRYSPLLPQFDGQIPPPQDLLPQLYGEMPLSPELLPPSYGEMPPPQDHLPQLYGEMPQPPDILPPSYGEMGPPQDLLPQR